MHRYFNVIDDELLYNIDEMLLIVNVAMTNLDKIGEAELDGMLCSIWFDIIFGNDNRRIVIIAIVGSLFMLVVSHGYGWMSLMVDGDGVVDYDVE
jgi:hypothetical protein